MQNVGNTEHLESSPQLQKELKSLLFWQPLSTLNVFRQRASVAQLVYQIVVIGCTQYLVIPDDVWVVDLRENCDLVGGKLP